MQQTKENPLVMIGAATTVQSLTVEWHFTYRSKNVILSPKLVLRQVDLPTQTFVMRNKIGCLLLTNSLAYYSRCENLKFKLRFYLNDFIKDIILSELILWSSYDHLVIILWSSYDHLMIILWSSYDHLMIAIWSSYDHYDHLVIILWSSYDHLVIILWSSYDHRLIILWSSYDHRLIIVWSS